MRGFTARDIWRWTGMAVISLLAILLIALYFLDWNRLRGPIGRYLSARSGREVRIDGNLKVAVFTLQPRIDVGGLFIGNPAWVGRPQGADVRHARIELRLLPLIFGHLILPLVLIDEPDLLVVRDGNGRTNWDSGAPSGTGWKLPPIRRFLVARGHIEVDDFIRKLKFTGTVDSQENAGGARSAFRLTGDGTLNSRKFLANVAGGPLLNVDESKPYNFTADLHAGQTHALVQGAITHPFHLDRFTAQASFSGRNLADLYDLTGLALPGTPPYHITGVLTRDGTLYRFTGLNGLLGDSDLRGDLSVDASGAIARLQGRLSSQKLDFDDLGALFGGGRTAPVAQKYLLPDVALHTEKLRQMNAEVDYTAATVKSRDFPLRGFSTHIGLEGGVLDLKPLALDFNAGRLAGELKIDARAEVPVTTLDARLSDIHMENFIKSADKPISGVVEARARLTGRGNSVHGAAASANGTLTAAIPSGAMRKSLAEWMGIDVLSALSLNLSGDTGGTRIRCAVAHFEARNGVLGAQQLVFDTDPVRVDGRGAVDLAHESVDFTLQGAPKSFQLLRVRAPITIKGPLAGPRLGADLKSAIAQGGIGAALGAVMPFAAILAFVDPGLASDANCNGLLSQAKGQGAPVKSSAVRNAPAAKTR